MGSLLILACAISCVTVVNKHIIGQIATITVVDAGLAFRARIDTGAKRTSIHAVNLHIENPSETMAENIGKEITFRIINEKNEEREIKTIVSDVSSVRSSQGREFRYVVELELAWKGVSKQVQVNLSNRKKMTYRLLIGRDWLQNDFIVDVERDVPENSEDDMNP